MLEYSDRKFIFMWLPKCAGGSILTALHTYYGDRCWWYNNQWDNLVFDHQRTCVTFYHSHLPSLVQTGFLPAEWALGAFKFTFVRNPWDRLVSLYFWLKSRSYGWLPETFEQFIAAVVEGNYPSPGWKNEEGYTQANPMLSWLKPNGVWIPNFIGKFENLNEHWEALCSSLAIPYLPLPVCNTTDHKPYQEYYTPSTRDLVLQHYAKDISAFNYKFE